MKHITVIGATGYVGGRLIPKLLEAGHEVRVLARSPERARRFEWSDDVTLLTGDVLDPRTLSFALQGCDVVYYLVHSMGSSSDFVEADARAARNVRDAADHAGVKRIIYLGGMGSDDATSAHLASRHEVGRILASGSTPTTELRAAVIIGSGSLSFEMLRYLVEVLPAMVTPTWVRSRCQPIAIRDVLHYLVSVIVDDKTVDRVLEIGGPDIVTYEEMMQLYANVAGLRRRLIVPVPVLTPTLSSHWIGLVTPLPAATAAPLVDSLRHEVIIVDHTIDDLVPHKPIALRKAIELALRRTRAEAVDTRWSDAGFTPADVMEGDPPWAGGATYTDEQVVTTTAGAADVYEGFARIGGDNGYYVTNWAWQLRGIADRALGGPGLRRGRRHPVDLRPGESLDFWRVTAVDVGRELVLQAEMKVPGKAWLRWYVTEPDDDGIVQLHQIASFAPRGLFGRAYWFAMLPFHVLIFARMARAIVRHAEAAVSR